MLNPNYIKASLAFRGAASTKEFDFKITGDHTPCLELVLDPGKTFITESGALLSKSSSIEMDTIFGDGVNEGGLFSKAWKAVKRSVSGESLFMTTFKNAAATRQHLTIAAPIPGEIFAVNLSELDGELICQRDSFLAAPMGVDVDLHIQKKIGFGLFGGEGFIMQKITGDDWVFLNGGGNIHVHELKEGETLDVDTSCLVATTKDVNMDIKAVGAKNFFFGGEGLFLAQLSGPGKVWVQTMPFSRLAGTIGEALRPMMRSEARSVSRN